MMKKIQNLYRVTCRGMTSNAVETAHGIAYVIAETPTEAYEKMRRDLDKRDLGFKYERELDRIELFAEDQEYPNCRFRIYT